MYFDEFPRQVRAAFKNTSGLYKQVTHEENDKFSSVSQFILKVPNVV